MRRRANAHAAVAAISLAAFVWLLTAVVNGSALPFDQHLRAEIHQWAVSPLTAAMKVVTFFGSTIWILSCAAFSVLVLKSDGHPRAAWTLAAAIAGAYPIENGLKYLVHRIRPEAFFDLVSPTTYSFPSGHALLSTTLYGTLGYVAARMAKSRLQAVVIWFCAAASVVLICFSRVYLGVHYPTDVAGGVLIAWFWVNAVLAFAKLP